MMISILSAANFTARKTAVVENSVVDAEGCNSGYYYVTNTVNGVAVDSLVIHTASNVMSLGELHELRVKIASSSGDAELAQRALAMKEPNSGTITSYPIQVVGVAAYGSDSLHMQLKVNLFQIFQKSSYLNSSGDYSYANVNVSVPRVAVINGANVLTNGYAAVDSWFQSAKAQNATANNGDVIVAVEDADGKWSSTGHSNQALQLDELSVLAFALMQKDDGSFLTETYQINGKAAKGYKARAAKLIGDFNIMNVVGSRAITPDAFDPNEAALLAMLSTSTTPVAKTSTPAGGSVDTSAANVLNKRLPRPA